MEQELKRHYQYPVRLVKKYGKSVCKYLEAELSNLISEDYFNTQRYPYQKDDVSLLFNTLLLDENEIESLLLSQNSIVPFFVSFLKEIVMEKAIESGKITELKQIGNFKEMFEGRIFKDGETEYLKRLRDSNIKSIATKDFEPKVLEYFLALTDRQQNLYKIVDFLIFKARLEDNAELSKVIYKQEHVQCLAEMTLSEHTANFMLGKNWSNEIKERHPKNLNLDLYFSEKYEPRLNIFTVQKDIKIHNLPLFENVELSDKFLENTSPNRRLMDRLLDISNLLKTIEDSEDSLKKSVMNKFLENVLTLRIEDLIRDTKENNIEGFTTSLEVLASSEFVLKMLKLKSKTSTFKKLVEEDGVSLFDSFHKFIHHELFVGEKRESFVKFNQDNYKKIVLEIYQKYGSVPILDILEKVDVSSINELQILKEDYWMNKNVPQATSKTTKAKKF